MLMRLLTATLGRYRRVLILVAVFQALQSFAGLVLPRLNADIIDKGVRTGDDGYIVRMGGWMLVVSLVQVGFSVAAVRWGSRAAMGFGRDTRASVFRRVNGFSAREVARFGAPSLITRITNDVQQVQMLVLMTCTLLLGAPFTAVGGLWMANREEASLSWILLVAIPLLAVAFIGIISRMVPTFRLVQERIDRINTILREQLTGIRVVRAFAREPEETARFAAANEQLTTTSLRGGRLMALMFPTVTIGMNLSSVAVVWFGADQIAAGRMGVGSLVAYLTYLTQILMSVMMASYIMALLPRASVSAERIMEVLDTESSVVETGVPVTPAEGPASLEFESVSFAYPGAGKPVLRDVTFRVDAGQVLAVVGGTGSGKTSLVNLVSRLVDATDGTVRVDGTDVRDMVLADLWSRLGVVHQKPYLFSGTVRSNLLFGRPAATEDEMWEALRAAEAADFVAALEGGLDAAVSQAGTNFSGGQRQRLSIARALVRRPRIYVFDDSFSALDTATDARVRAALARWTRDAVTVVVAQRVSTVLAADLILVLEDGEVVGLGRHEDLMVTCPTYAEIVDSQRTALAGDLPVAGVGE
jgi:ATP-binding cassette subfamily B protein